MRHSLKDRLKSSVSASGAQVFLRSDFDRFGDYRQVSRALTELEKEAVLVRGGYGVYLKPGTRAPAGQIVAHLKTRLGKRVNRTLTLGGTTVQLGLQARNSPNAQARLDQFKLRLAQTLLEKIDLPTLRRKSLANLARWKSNGVWCSAYGEWAALLRKGSDHEVRTVLTGCDEHANRLRQSAPYTGLLDQPTVYRLRETKTA